MKKIIIATLGTALLWSTCTLSMAATLTSMTKSQVMKALQGNTITTPSMATLNKVLIENSFSGYFAKDGTVQGQFATKPDNGPQKDEGKWMVAANGSTCVRWNQWNDNKPICVSFYNVANAYILINNMSNTLETVMLKDHIQSGNQLS